MSSRPRLCFPRFISRTEERNDFKDQFVKVKRQHEDAVKEINQNMNVRIKASKDIKRLTDERNAAMQVPLKRMSLKAAVD